MPRLTFGNTELEVSVNSCGDFEAIRADIAGFALVRISAALATEPLRLYDQFALINLLQWWHLDAVAIARRTYVKPPFAKLPSPFNPRFRLVVIIIV